MFACETGNMDIITRLFSFMIIDQEFVKNQEFMLEYTKCSKIIKKIKDTNLQKVFDYINNKIKAQIRPYLKRRSRLGHA